MLSKRQKIMLSVVGVVVLGLVFSQAILVPQLTAYEDMEAKLAKQTQQLKQVKALTKFGANQDDLIHQSEKKLTQVESQFKAEVSDGAGMVKLALATIHEKIELIGFQPLPIQDKMDYYEAPFRMVLRGDFVDILRYFKSLEQQKILPNPVELRDLKITQPKLTKKEKQNDNPGGISTGMINAETNSPLAMGTVEASFVLMTYSAHDPHALLALEEIRQWAVGRENPFLYPGQISPYLDGKPVEGNNIIMQEGSFPEETHG